jgi:hypothetical protein
MSMIVPVSESRRPLPLAQVVEQAAQLAELIREEVERAVVVARFLRFTWAEIAQQAGCVESTALRRWGHLDAVDPLAEVRVEVLDGRRSAHFHLAAFQVDVYARSESQRLEYLLGVAVAVEAGPC